jgi:NTE family protein
MVIAGGAMKVMSVIGIIKYLEEKRMMSSIKNFVGTSAGSIISLLLCLGYTSEEIKRHVLEAVQDKTLTTFEADGIFDMFSTYGINSGESLENLFNKLIYKKYKTTNMTFIDLAKVSGKNLVVCVSNLSKEKHEFFNVDNTPNYSVAQAVRISCSIPILFCPVNIDDNLYLDGGIYNNFPIDYFTDNHLRDILAINITVTNYQKHDNFLQYVRYIFNSLIEKFHKKSVNIEEQNVITLEFDDDDGWFTFSEVKFTLTKELLEKYIEMGYQAVLTHLHI